MIELLKNARHEILRLRRENEILRAKESVLEIFAAVLGMRQGSGGMIIDVAWELERKIKELQESKVKKEK